MSNSKLLSDDPQSSAQKASNNDYVAFDAPPSPKLPKASSVRFGLSKSPPVESTLGNKNKYEPLSSNRDRDRSYSIDSMADGNRRKNKKNGWFDSSIPFCVYYCIFLK